MSISKLVKICTILEVTEDDKIEKIAKVLGINEEARAIQRRQYAKQYYHKNKEKFKKKTCKACKTQVYCSGWKKHLNTKKHLDAVNDLEE